MRQLFLDSNTYLGFYSLSPADVAELDKLFDLVKLGKLRLLLSSQVTDEVKRNRARVVAEQLRQLRDARLQVPIPGLASGTDSAETLKKAVATTQKHHSQLVDELTCAARDRSLPADRLITKLFEAAKTLIHSEALQAAQRRKALGNPPGKGSSLGDGVNWETILAHGQAGEDLCFVSGDSDFANPLDLSQFDDFLAEEWAVAKLSSVKFFRDIKGFLDHDFPDIRIASDVQKYFLINRLINSTNFAETHSVVAALEAHQSFTLDEASRLLNGSIENSQVRWLAGDQDVKELIQRILSAHKSALLRSLVSRWDYVIAEDGLAYGAAPTEEQAVARLQ
jgi:hypothetical protein